MSSSVRRMLWGAFAGLALLTIAGIVFTIAVLRMEQRLEQEVVQQSRPLLDAVRKMDEALITMVSAARGYTLNRSAAFTQQYADAVREFETARAIALQHATDARDRAMIDAFHRHFEDIKKLTDLQIEQSKVTGNREAVA